ncbi:carbohydrate ABC transporter permease [Propionimicrobium sp. PCR01-08-3]|uniref:carbohydrate ABC transporter permease n=1 Tax=Propionimicrobium sp. PCR01-08-3 TaxID=3052086 RepID=UPI00255D0F65|nr:carbohydrate ABC transporter permease [Propionimicrobium sp. PCR01-08-3]WIY81902.1 carbohydrate ABC transporter permease [Propionimicrobium sp. PCR01-08-3]
MNHNSASKTVYYVLTSCLAITFLAPLVWAVISSVSPAPGTAQLEGFGFGNYRSLFDYSLGLPTYLWHSVVVSVVAVVVTMLAAATGGYAFARFNFRGKNLLFVLVLSVMMVPVAALLIPLIVWMKQIGLADSLVGVGLVLTLFQLPFGVFMMRNSFAAIPKELEEAAKIDGCSDLGAFFKVMLPTVLPALITVGLFAYLAAWNDFMVSLYLVSMDNAPLPLALVNMRQKAMGVIDYGSTTAGVVILTLPALVLFLALQKYYVKGFTSGAVKG